MGKTLKYTAILLIGLGMIVGFAGFAMLGFDYKKLSREKINKKHFETAARVGVVSIETEVSNVVIKKSEDNFCRVDYGESKNIKIDVSVDNETLRIKENDKRKWYEFIGAFNFYPDDHKITVYLPEKVYYAITVKSDTGDIGVYSIPVDGNIKLTTDTGDVTVFNLTCEDVIVDVDTGDVDIETVRCNNIKLRTDTGEVDLTDMIAKGELNVDTDTGDVNFKDIDAETIVARTDTGDIEGTILSDKIFMAKADTGDVKVPDSLTGGACKLTTDTGDITIKYSLK